MAPVTRPENGKKRKKEGEKSKLLKTSHAQTSKNSRETNSKNKKSKHSLRSQYDDEPLKKRKKPEKKSLEGMILIKTHCMSHGMYGDFYDGGITYTLANIIFKGF